MTKVHCLGTIYDKNQVGNSPTFRKNYNVDENANTARPTHYIDGYLDVNEDSQMTNQEIFSPQNMSNYIIT